MSMKSGEELTLFMARMKKVAKKAYPDLADAVLEPMVGTQFVMALPAEVKKLVYLMEKKPETCAELVTACTRFMQVQQSTQKGACARVDLEEDKLDAVLKKVEALSVEVASIRTTGSRQENRADGASQNRGFREFRGNCRKCGQWGHMARFCNVKQEVRCDLCGNSGHVAADCMLNVRKGCRKCGNPGHGESGCKFKGKPLNWQ